MMSWLRRIIYCGITLLVLLGASIYWCLNSVGFTQKTLPRLINSFQTNWKIVNLTAGRQQFDWRGIFQVDNLSCELNSEGKPYQFSIKSLSAVRRSNNASLQQRELKDFYIEIKGLEAHLPAGDIQQGEVRGEGVFNREQSLAINGTIRLGDLTLEGYHWQNVSCMFLSDKKIFKCDDLEAGFYGGKMNGQILLEMKPDFPYSIKISFRQVDLALLQSTGPTVVSMLQGNISGTLSLGGQRQSVDSFDLDILASEGGKVKASVLGPLVEHIPAQTQQRQELNRLVEEDGFLPLEKASGEIKYDGREQLSGEFHLFSKELNLSINYPVTINIEGGILNLVEQLQQFSSP